MALIEAGAGLVVEPPALASVASAIDLTAREDGATDDLEAVRGEVGEVGEVVAGEVDDVMVWGWRWCG
jgi:hypothetical protein